MQIRRLGQGTAAPARQQRPHRLSVPCHRGTLQRVAAKRNFGEKLSAELLDVVTGGPKMRKWYGQESNNVPRDGGEQPQEQEQEQQQQQASTVPQVDAYDGPRDVIMVTDADTPTGELVTLQLILLRAKVRILVKDTVAAKNGYGPYVEPVSVDINSQGGLARALQGVKSVVALGRLGALLPAAQRAGVERVVLLSTAGMPQPGGVAALFQNGADAGLKDPTREAALSSSSIPHIVVKAGVIQDVPGGSSKVSVAPHTGGGSSSSSQRSSISREDLASAVVASAVYLPSFGTAGAAQMAFEVQDAGPGRPPEDWEQLLEGLTAGAAAV